MYEEHEEIETPSDDTVIWRYIGLEKLLALIASGCLTFNRLDRFKDRWEGHWPTSIMPSLRSTLPGMRHLAVFVEHNRLTSFVNCWHANPYESAALWDLYPSAVAIRSSVKRLKNALDPEVRVFIGNVRYIDFQTDDQVKPVNALIPLFLKRKSFEHEREVRVLVWSPDFGTDGAEASTIPPVLDVKSSVPDLIDALYISPTSKKWLVPHIRALFAAFGYPDVPVIRSELYDDRVY